VSAYCVGDRARAMTRLDGQGRIDSTLKHVERVRPGARASFERGASKCWDEDPWTRGDYCYFKPGQITSILPAIAAVEGRIHFAGEHASSAPGSMQGALESGNRVVAEIALRE
jgi:monoamine oxidase